jgi:hypothetical protein
MPGRPRELKAAVCSSAEAIKANEEHLPLSLICSQSCEKLGPAKLFQRSQERNAFRGGRVGQLNSPIGKFCPGTLNLRSKTFQKFGTSSLGLADKELSSVHEKVLPPIFCKHKTDKFVSSTSS